MNNLSIRTKLLGGFTIVLGLLMIVGVVGMYCLSLANRYSDEATNQNEIVTHAEVINSCVYQARYAAMRGTYGKDVQTKPASEKEKAVTYRDYLDGRIEEVYATAKENVEETIKRLSDDKPRDKEDKKLCEEIETLFRQYANLTTQWADYQDDILKSAASRKVSADAMQAAVKRIIEVTVSNAEKEERMVQIDGKDEPYTHKRLADRQMQLGDLLERIELCRRLTREQITITDTAALLNQNVKVDQAFKETKAKISEVLPLFRTPVNREHAEAAEKHFLDWEKEVANYNVFVEKQKILFDQFVVVANKVVGNANTVIEHAREDAEKAQQELDSTASRAFWLICGAIVFAVVVGIFAGLYLTSNITRGIGSAVEAMTLIARDGDLSFDIPENDLKRKDEIGILSKSLDAIMTEFRNVEVLSKDLAAGDWTGTIKVRGEKDAMNVNLSSMLDQVNEALFEINESVQQVNTGAGEVSSASQTLSSGAQESAASLEEITASMSEISSQTKANAESAGQARDLAQKATQAASEGQAAMGEMNEAMDRITKNSSEIQRVIKVIDDIAFQTNLLALNAAVEAARAGAHGKGFAVVAEEVRNLAARSAKAAQETNDLISKSGSEINRGGEVASRTAEVLNSIVDQIKQTTDLVAGIAVASNEQAQGVAQITVGLQQIDAVTQQNTAAAEESASAANEMSGMATNLQGLVSRFKIRHAGGGRVSPSSVSTHRKPAAPATIPVKPSPVAQSASMPAEKPSVPAGDDNWGGGSVHIDLGNDKSFGKY